MIQSEEGDSGILVPSLGVARGFISKWIPGKHLNLRMRRGYKVQDLVLHEADIGAHLIRNRTSQLNVSAAGTHENAGSTSRYTPALVGGVPDSKVEPRKLHGHGPRLVGLKPDGIKALERFGRGVGV